MRWRSVTSSVMMRIQGDAAIARDGETPRDEPMESSPSVPCARSSTGARLAPAPHVFEARTHVRVRVGRVNAKNGFPWRSAGVSSGPARLRYVMRLSLSISIFHPMACGVQSCTHLTGKVAQLDLRPDAAPSCYSSRDCASDQAVDVNGARINF